MVEVAAAGTSLAAPRGWARRPVRSWHRGVAWIGLVLGSVVVAACARPVPSVAPAAAGDDLEDVARVDPTIQIDLRYATARNFTGHPVYPVAARCLLRRDVALRLARVQQRLRAEGLGLRVWDCYRPFAVQERFWALVPDARYVAEPIVRDGRPVAGSKHNRGAAVDLTLVDGAGRPLAMPTDFDDFSARAHRGSMAGGAAATANAARLASAMAAEGFAPFATEWWHFDGPNWEAYPLADVPLD